MSLGCPSSPLEMSPSVAVLHGDVHIRAAFSLSIVNLISGVFFLLPIVSHQQKEEERRLQLPHTSTPTNSQLGWELCEEKVKGCNSGFENLHKGLL